MRILSLFDGISCGRVALDRAGFAVDDYAAFEIDRFAVQTSQKNYPDIRRFGNVFDGNFTQFEGEGIFGVWQIYLSVGSDRRSGRQYGVV